MQFGVQFFPDVKPEERSARDYFADCLAIAEEADRLGFTHARIVEHYFHHYGGYSPNPMLFLAAAAQRTKRLRLVTGAVLPVFNHPLKLAGEIAMLDAISGGRLDVGFARAFLPHEFRRFGISPNQSVERYREGIEQVDLLLRQENVTHRGKFHVIEETTSLPRPTQKPRPKFYVAALTTPDSFEFAGRSGYSVMAIPMGGGKMRELIGAYRKAWRDAGHAGAGEVMLAFHMFCAADGGEARDFAREPLNAYLRSLVDAAAEWTEGLSSADYPGYDKVIARLRESSMETMVESGAAWIGSPRELRQIIAGLEAEYGSFEHASLQINFNTISREAALASLRLFAREVLPHFIRQC
ncbi:MAG: LLM class flavin-dependent oxidoreductase [Alphaproteobacteria bacterium]|nr:LLM class flavin-dependent oxidoreductase [Alphaproteobacteria bacterium]